jgi:hypothetical protein
MSAKPQMHKEEGDAKVWERAAEAFWKNIGKYSNEVNGDLVVPKYTFRLTTAKKV